MEWIDVNDRLPDEMMSVLVLSKGKNYVNGYAVAYINSVCQWCVDVDMLEASNYDGPASIRFCEKITHWCLLPFVKSKSDKTST